jgi:hypothetical protein
MDTFAIHKETGKFWDSIADWYGERDEPKQSNTFSQAATICLKMREAYLVYHTLVQASYPLAMLTWK